MEQKRTYVIDVDGTLCKSFSGMDYSEAEAILDVIDKVNEKYEAGHEIILFTARGMKTHSGNFDKISECVKPVLMTWLFENNVKYDEMIVGKPWGPNVVYVDDKAIRPDEFLNDDTPEELFKL